MNPLIPGINKNDSNSKQKSRRQVKSLTKSSLNSNNYTSKHNESSILADNPEKISKQQLEDIESQSLFSNLNKKVIGKEELNSIIFKLKSYYNELNDIRSKGNVRLKQLEEKNSSYLNKVQELDSLQDIHLPSANLIVSIKNQGPFVESKEAIEERLLKLIEKKKELQDNLLKEQEYSNTLDHMIQCEKKKMESINKKIVDYSEKCKEIKLARKNLEENELEHNKKMRNFNDVKKQLNKETEKLDEVITFQNDSINKLNQELQYEKNKLEKKKIEVSNLQVTLKEDVIKKKEELVEKIRNTKAEKDSIVTKENYYIKLILGMSIIQNHFIKKFKNNSNEAFEKFNENEVLESEDYLQFCADRFVISDEYFDNLQQKELGVDSKNHSNININNNQFTSDSKQPQSQYSSNNNTSQNFYKVKNITSPKKQPLTGRNKVSSKTNFKSLKVPDSNKTLYGSIVKKNNSFIFNSSNNKKSFNFNLTKANSTKKSLVNFSKTHNKFYDPNSKSNKFRSSSMDNLQNNDNDEIINYINIADLKDKFENLDITFEDINDFYTKLNSQISHYQNTMMTFNKKQINLETQKDMYTDKVKEILKKNYKNFDELVKHNSRFSEFMKEYQTMIRHEHEKDKIGKFLTIPDNNNEYRKFYLKCNNIISEFKAFFEFFYNNFKSIVNELSEELKMDYNVSDLKSRLEKILVEFFPKLGDESDSSFVKKIKEDFITYYQDKIKDLPDKVYDSSHDYIDYDLLNDKETLESYHDFITNLNDEDLFKVKVPYEKAIYNFFSKQSEIIDIFNSCISIIEYITENKMKNLNKNSTQSSDPQSDKFNIEYLKNISKNLDSYDMLVEEKEIYENNIKDNTNEKVRSLGKYDAKNKYIIEKFYNPFIEKQKYRLSLNENMGKIKKMTRNDAFINFNLNKKKNEIDKIANEIKIYNNPKINLNSLSNNTYNKFVKHLIKNQLELDKKYKRQELLEERDRILKKNK